MQVRMQSFKRKTSHKNHESGAIYFLVTDFFENFLLLFPLNNIAYRDPLYCIKCMFSYINNIFENTCRKSVRIFSVSQSSFPLPKKRQ